MTQDEIIRMAREAGLHKMIQVKHFVHKVCEIPSEKLERFAALVAAHEREKLRCAIILNDDGGTYSTHESKEQLEWMLNMSPAKEVIEAAVLAEREACAKVCDEMYKPEDSAYHWIPDGRGALQYAASGIRARGEK